MNNVTEQKSTVSDSTYPESLVKLNSRDYNVFLMNQLWLLFYVLHQVAVVCSLIDICSFHKQGRRNIHRPAHVTTFFQTQLSVNLISGWCHKLNYLPPFLVPSNNRFGSFDILIAATDIKALGGKGGADKINVKLMLSVAITAVALPHLTQHQFNVNFVNLSPHPMEISPSNNMFALTDLHDDKSITDEFPLSWHELVSHYLKY